ncbi:hypothetical protein EPH_0025690 [Eimeria praecox]|uniref:Uncharacterized protein n=1 Tax=Eimeria praecox TaxID=51316 RepID=U6G991_9EIME|nr:hypothetical protein EPH_0025690 [Eimeria praecox]
MVAGRPPTRRHTLDASGFVYPRQYLIFLAVLGAMDVARAKGGGGAAGSKGMPQELWGMLTLMERFGVCKVKLLVWQVQATANSLASVQDIAGGAGVGPHSSILAGSGGQDAMRWLSRV